jgi:diguanylate cyclase (GGDEF)-like protein/PAS domain S-box-containing protein
MSLAVFIWMTAGALVACAAAACLWRASTGAEPSAKNAYRWLTVVALAWGAALVVQEGLPDPGLAESLTLADLLALIVLPVLAVGVVGLAPARPPEAAHEVAPARQAGAITARLADGFLLVAALFVVGWTVFYGPAYARGGVSAGVFAHDLIHPLADLVVLGILVVYAGAAWRRSLLPWLALLAVTAGDSLAISARIAGLHPGTWALLAQLTGLALLAAVPLVRSGPQWRWRSGPPLTWPSASTTAAAIAATAAALTVIGWALGGGSAAGPAVVIAGGIALLALVIRVVGLAWHERAASEIGQESGRGFRELANRTSDVVVLCDLGGIITFASPAVAQFGYTPQALEGTPLSGLIHPEDRLSATRMLLATVRAAADQTARFSCRVRSADGTWHHVESNLSRHSHPGTPDKLLITARDVSDQVALRRQVTHLTFHDGLTGLPNRAYLKERAKNAAGRPPDPAESAVAAAIFIDLDGFTGVNDSVGHRAGDLLLAQAARRLRAAVPPQYTVARWGGDEFAVLVENAASTQEIVDIAERLAGAIAGEPFRVAGVDVSMTASIGVALEDVDPPGHLLRNADVAMSRAKESGGGHVEVFAAHMHADVVRRLELTSDLRQAITKDELELEYQAVVELATSRVVWVETLVRWRREQTAIRPVEFLGVAEESGLIMSLGEQVLRAACAQAAAWHSSGWPIGISVNFSLRQVSTAGFAELVLDVLADSGLTPAALTLEVTERVLVEGAGSMVEALARLRRHGVRLAIDDFGTGYASLAYLRQLPVDIIKIDPSFVAGLGTDATLGMLTATIVRVGHDLGIEVVAEGIERPEQLELLRRMGCGLGQGFLVAGPMAAGRIESFAAAFDVDQDRVGRPEPDLSPEPGRRSPEPGREPVPGGEPVPMAAPVPVSAAMSAAMSAAPEPERALEPEPAREPKPAQAG